MICEDPFKKHSYLEYNKNFYSAQIKLLPADTSNCKNTAEAVLATAIVLWILVKSGNYRLKKQIMKGWSFD